MDEIAHLTGQSLAYSEGLSVDAKDLGIILWLFRDVDDRLSWLTCLMKQPGNVVRTRSSQGSTRRYKTKLVGNIYAKSFFLQTAHDEVCAETRRRQNLQELCDRQYANIADGAQWLAQPLQRLRADVRKAGAEARKSVALRQSRI